MVMYDVSSTTLPILLVFNSRVCVRAIFEQFGVDSNDVLLPNQEA